MAVADLAFSTRTLSVISSFKLRGSREVSVEFVLSAQLNQVRELFTDKLTLIVKDELK